MEIVARRAGDGRTTLRGVIKGGDVPAGARAVADVTLEEAYLAFMVGRGHDVDEIEIADGR